MLKRTGINLIFAAICLCAAVFQIIPVYAQETQVGSAPVFPPDEYARGRVTQVIYEGSQEGLESSSPFQIILVKILSGEMKGEEIEIRHGERLGIDESQKVAAGDRIIVGKSYTVSGIRYYVADKDRLFGLGWVVAVFLALAIWFGRIKGISSVVGLSLSILILTQFIVPRILAGDSPLLITIIGSLLIASTSLFLSHGFNRRTTLAFISTMITLSLAIGLALLFTDLTQLLGTGSEEAFFLSGPLSSVNLKGLLLGGMVIGTLGVLDDITTAQTAAVGEISRANPKLDAHELYNRGLTIGREHIASLINTLVLAYAGAAMPIFLGLAIYNTQPIWVLLNSEYVAEEIVRTMVGSSALILAVPITTVIAARFLRENHKSKSV